MTRVAVFVALLGVPLWARAQEPASSEVVVTDATEMQNINARYVVEDVEIAGIADESIDQLLRDELQALVGSRLDPARADELRRRLEAERPDYEVERRISRGTASGRIRLVFRFRRTERSRWIPFAPSRSKLIYHEDQGWSVALDVPVGGRRDHRFTLGLVRGNADDLIEEYSGYRLRVESRDAVTKRLGLSLEWSRLTQRWRRETLSRLDANPGIPRAYRSRTVVEPAVTFAFSPRLRLRAGASVSELEPLPEVPGPSLRASAAFASARFDRTWESESGPAHSVEAGYDWRAGLDALGSDLAYRRHVGHVRYELERGRNRVIAEFRVGGLTGTAPLFERFSLGDSSTLRGWNKYDIAPAGVDRLVHQSIEFRHRAFAYFLDVGYVWQTGADAPVRISTGVGFHGEHGFLTLGVPLNADDIEVAFMLGVRF
jgi:hypothetical protein